MPRDRASGARPKVHLRRSEPEHAQRASRRTRSPSRCTAVDPGTCQTGQRIGVAEREKASRHADTRVRRETRGVNTAIAADLPCQAPPFGNDACQRSPASPFQANMLRAYVWRTTTPLYSIRRATHPAATTTTASACSTFASTITAASATSTARKSSRALANWISWRKPDACSSGCATSLRKEGLLILPAEGRWPLLPRFPVQAQRRQDPGCRIQGRRPLERCPGRSRHR